MISLIQIKPPIAVINSHYLGAMYDYKFLILPINN